MDKDTALKLALDLALEALENFADVIKYDNEQDDIGYRACCYVLSYDQHSENCKATKAITAIKQARSAQQEHEPENEPHVSLASVQEPVACDCNQGQVCHVCDPITPPAAQPAPVREDWGPGPHEVHSLPAPVQEPTCKQSLQVWVISNGKGAGQFSWDPQDERFWTRMEPAAQRQWVGLTELQLDMLVHRFGHDPMKLVIELTQELKEKNT